MTNKYKQRARYGIIIFALTFLINVILGLSLGTANFNTIYYVISVIGSISLIIGLYYLAKSKGYSGIFAILGLPIVFLLRDRKNPKNKKKNSYIFVILFLIAFLALFIFSVIVGYLNP